jgi:hypothetical protein
MNVVVSCENPQVRAFAATYAELSGKVFLGSRSIDGAHDEAQGSLLYFYEPRELTTEDGLHLMSACRRKGIALGMYPVDLLDERRTRAPMLHERTVGEGIRTLASYFEFVDAPRLFGLADSWGKSGWRDFLESAGGRTDAVVVHTHGSGGCFALGKGALCARNAGSHRSDTEHHLPCQGGGECFRAADLEYRSADDISARVVALLSCLALSFSDALLAPQHTFLAALLRSARTAAVLTSFRVVMLSTLDGMLVDWMLRAGFSVGEIAATLNELKGGEMPWFVCVGDPDVRVSDSRCEQSWRKIAEDAARRIEQERIHVEDELRWARLGEFAKRVFDETARSDPGRLFTLGKALGGDRQSVEEVAAALPEELRWVRCCGAPALTGKHRELGLDAHLQSMAAGLVQGPAAVPVTPAGVSRAFAEEMGRTSSYLHGLWQSTTTFRRERDRGLHVCGNRLYGMEYQNHVFTDADYEMWVCAACGVVGYTCNGRALPSVEQHPDDRLALRGLGDDEFWVAASIEPLREVRAPVVDPVQSRDGKCLVVRPKNGSPGVNWVGVVGVGKGCFFGLRVPVIGRQPGAHIQGCDWRLAWHHEKESGGASRREGMDALTD